MPAKPISADKKRRHAAKARGREWEYRVAKTFGGKRQPLSRDGDVQVSGWMLECKYTNDGAGVKLLNDWIVKAKSDAKKLGLNWAIALNFGDNSGGYAVLPIAYLNQILADSGGSRES